MSLRRIVYIVVWALYFAAVLYLSFASFEGGGFDKLNAIPHIDKIVHFSMYGILTAFGVGYLLIAKKKGRYIFIYVLSVIVVSGLVELFQPFTHRNKDLFDFMANTAGVLSAMAVVYALRDVLIRIYKRSKK